MKKRLRLVEADQRVFQTKKETALKARLLNLLKDDGRGHHHAKYAARLQDFILQIVPVKGPGSDPKFTAGISFEEGIIYISEGFINNEATFFQLSVILRHELAHNLLMHEVRMLHKLGDELSFDWQHMRFSAILQDLWNIIMDFEISNRKYSDYDKDIVRNTYLNGRIISGLVTEDHRQDWRNLTLEEMYDQLTDELAKMKADLASGKSIGDIGQDKANDRDWLGTELAKAFLPYTDITSPSSIKGSLEDFVDYVQKAKSRNGNDIFPDTIKEIVNSLYDNIAKDTTGQYTKEVLEDYLKNIAGSSPIERIVLKSPSNHIITIVQTPEEKQKAVAMLKKMLNAGSDDDSDDGQDGEPGDDQDDGTGDNDFGDDMSGNPGGKPGSDDKASNTPKKDASWYEKIQATLTAGNYSPDEIADLLNKIS